jgi:hypothetical protein
MAQYCFNNWAVHPSGMQSVRVRIHYFYNSVCVEAHTHLVQRGVK